MIEIKQMNASAWGCWKCGRGFTDVDIPFAADVKPQNDTPETEHYLLFAPICTDCATLPGRTMHAKLYGCIEELETIKLRAPLLWIFGQVYIQMRLKELRRMLRNAEAPATERPQ